MSEMLIVESSGGVASQVRRMLESMGCSLLPDAANLTEADRRLYAERPLVLIVGPSGASDALEWTPAHASPADPSVVLVVDAVDTGVLRAALRAGISDVVSVADGPHEVASAVLRAAEEAARRREAAVTAAVAAAHVEATAGASKGRVVTVFSTKGGVGKTVISTNIACALAKKNGKSVAIVDLDLQFGDVAIVLGIEPQRTVHDVVQSFDRLDPEMLEKFLATHADSGVRALLAPVRPEEAESVSASRVSRILEMLKGMFDIVVVDTAPAFSDVLLAALDKSDDVYVVTMMDVASIKNTRISLQKLRQLGYDSAVLRLVLNRADSKVFLKPSEVEEAIGGRLTARIPSDLLVPRSVNKGVPVVLDSPRSEVSRTLLALAEEIAGREGSEEQDVA